MVTGGILLAAGGAFFVAWYVVKNRTAADAGKSVAGS
jgi:hypothetical protein